MFTYLLPWPLPPTGILRAEDFFKKYIKQSLSVFQIPEFLQGLFSKLLSLVSEWKG